MGVYNFLLSMILPCIGADNNPATGGNSDGPPAASGNSLVSAANSSNTSHAAAQMSSSNSVSTAECSNNNQPTVADGSNDNSNSTVADLPVTFNNPNTNNSQAVSGGPVTATSTSQSLHNSNGNAIAQESGDQSNGLHQCNSPILLIASGEGSTASSSIQPFAHGEAREQILNQQEVEVSLLIM